MATSIVRDNPYKSCELPQDLMKHRYSDRWLFAAENLILDTFANELGASSMLDIGVGTGRTTHFFAPRVARYVGIDFNIGMIEACRHNFPALARNLIPCDARSMDAFPDGYFDFVLFSHNGLDYLSSSDRVKALVEVRRVGKSGGLFLFSSHNLNSVRDLLTLRLTRDLRCLTIGLWRFAVLTLMNERQGALISRDFAIVYDASHHFYDKLSWFLTSLRQRIGYTYYIKPPAQVRQLRSLGFTDVRVLNLYGRQIDSEDELAGIRDETIHYCCRI